MSTIITAGNATNNGASLLSAADGELEFKTGSGAGTTALTLSSTQNLSFNSGYGSAAVAYGCRAWVNFNGTTNTGGFCTIRASGNVTSVADNGTGNYTVNFTTAMPDANFAYNITGRASSGLNGQQPWPYSVTAPTTTSVNCVFGNMSAGGATYTTVDPVDVCVSVFR
jgi:hypothetical protein